jgi:diguanylate cyclase (GGDEF)-like protein/PAS domain S-box-containing protein
MSDPADIYRELLDCLEDGVYFTDSELRIAYWNRGAEILTGFSREEVIGSRCRDNLLMHVDDSGRVLCLDGCPLSATLEDGQPREAQVFLHHKKGHRVPIRVRVVPRRDEAGNIVGAVEVFTDNTATLQMAEQLAQMEKLALLDSLTGLANRRYLESAIRSRLEELRRNNWHFGILYMDLDNFKSVNDRYGHETGDNVLRMVGRTLSSSARYFDTIGRLGGEEFLAVIANAGRKALSNAGERLRTLVGKSTLEVPECLSVTISVGCAVASPEDTVESLLARADEKLYEAKKAGKNCVCI